MNTEKLEQWLREWPERLAARDQAFVERLSAEIMALDAMGYDDREKKTALSGRLYVREWAYCPRWLECVHQLPAPLKWRDGVTYKRAKHPAVKVIVYSTSMFLYYKNCEPVGAKYGEHMVLVIHGWNALSQQDLVNGLPNGQQIEWAIQRIAADFKTRATNNYVHFLKPLSREAAGHRPQHLHQVGAGGRNEGGGINE